MYMKKGLGASNFMYFLSNKITSSFAYTSITIILHKNFLFNGLNMKRPILYIKRLFYRFNIKL